MHHLLKVDACSQSVCVCVCVPLYVSEPTPWISWIGQSKDEQSGIKSILILARQEPPLLLGDTATEGREKQRTNPPPPSAPVISSLSPSFTLQLSLSCSSTSCFCSYLFLSSFFFFQCPVSCCPPLYLWTLAAPYFILLSPSGLCTAERSCWHGGDGRRPFVKFKAVELRFQQVPGGSLRKLFSMKITVQLGGEGTGPTAYHAHMVWISKV